MENEYDTDQERHSPESSWPRNRECPWEDKFVDEYGAELEALENQTKIEQEHLAQNMWHSFQNSAASATHLYKGEYSVIRWSDSIL